jgi:hypothetical protein
LAAIRAMRQSLVHSLALGAPAIAAAPHNSPNLACYRYCARSQTALVMTLAVQNGAREDAP